MIQWIKDYFKPKPTIHEVLESFIRTVEEQHKLNLEAEKENQRVEDNKRAAEYLSNHLG